MSFRRYIFLQIIFGICFMPSLQSQSIQTLVEKAYDTSNPKEIIVLLEDSKSEIIKSADSLQAKYYYRLGVGYGMQYQNDSAFKYFSKSLDIGLILRDTLTQIISINGLSNLARIDSDNETAIEYYESALALTENKKQTELKVWRSRLLGNIGGIYYDLEDYTQANDYAIRAYQTAKELGDSSAVAISAIQISYSFMKLDDPEKALEYNRLALGILEKQKDSSLLIFQYNNLGSIYLELNNYQLAQEAYLRCRDLSASYGEFENLASSNIALGKISHLRSNFKNATDYAEKGLKITFEHNLQTNMLKAYDLLYDINKSKMDFSKANEYLELSYALKDSIKNRETLEKINEFKIKYETAEKEKEIASLNLQNQITSQELKIKRRTQLGLTILLITIIAFGIFAYLSQKQKSKLKEQALLGELSDLRLQIKELIGKYEGQVDLDFDKLNDQLVNPFSKREYDVFQQIFMSKSNREIAEDLHLSVNTVKTHLKNIYSKLGVSNRSDALKSLINQIE